MRYYLFSAIIIETVQILEKAMPTSTFAVNRGSDLTFELNWPDGPSANADLTGHNVSVFEPDPRLDGLISATLTDPANGTIRVRIEWADNLPSKTSLRFRIATASGAEKQTTNQLAVEYS